MENSVLFSTAEAAAWLGLRPVTVRWYYRRYRIGRLVGRVLVFTQAELQKIQEHGRGRKYG